MKPGSPGARLMALSAFAIAMGWLEGVVVVYIRSLLGMERGQPMPEPAAVMERLRSVPWLIGTEQTREVATLVMLAAVAWVAAGAWRERLGALLVCFGVWDITYYVALFAMLRWPPGLGTMDLLFLIPPHPIWYQPVWVPVAISAVMIAAGATLFGRRASAAGPGAAARPGRPRSAEPGPGR
jgi:hypothetical protein